MTSGLAGRTVVVTRPLAQCGPLAEAIRAAGGEPLIFPLLAIGPASDPAPLAEAARDLVRADFAIFVSPNAVEHSLPVLLAEQSWPAALCPVAIGHGTVRALAAHGIGGCLVPSGRFDSEAVLDLPALAEPAVCGATVLLFRGDGGRELLADTLRARGATVRAVPCYSRSGPPGDVALLEDAWQKGRLDAITLSSSEGLRYLWAQLSDAGRTWLAGTPLFVPHERIAAGALALGLRRVILTPPADDGLLAGLQAYNGYR